MNERNLALVGGWAIIVFLLLGTIIVPFTHEGGHAIVAILRGGQVTHWWPIAIGYLPGTSATNQNDPFVIAAGSVNVVLVWLAITIVLIWRLPRMNPASRWFPFVIVAWGLWSLFAVCEPYVTWVRDIYKLPYDGAHFVQVTHLDPRFVSAICIKITMALAIFALSCLCWFVWTRKRMTAAV